MRCAAASWRTPRSGSVRQVADGGWRVTVTLHDAAHAQRAVQSVREVPAPASVHARAVPFTHFGLDQIGSGPVFPLT